MDTVQRMLVTLNVSIYLGSSAEFLFVDFSQFSLIEKYCCDYPVVWDRLSSVSESAKFYIFHSRDYIFVIRISCSNEIKLFAILHSFIFFELSYIKYNIFENHHLDNKSFQRFNQIFILLLEKLNYYPIFRSASI